jgi:HPt (histidine-containing phosphotransfer) domain-containing protein
MPSARPQNSIVAPESPRINVERFRADLREGGVEEMLGLLLETFVQDCPGRLAALEQAVVQENAKMIESAAHAFKSGAGTVHATVLADRLRQVEAAGHSGDLSSVVGLLEQVRAECLAVLRELGTIRQQ